MPLGTYARNLLATLSLAYPRTHLLPRLTPKRCGVKDLDPLPRLGRDRELDGLLFRQSGLSEPSSFLLSRILFMSSAFLVSLYSPIIRMFAHTFISLLSFVSDGRCGGSAPFCRQTSFHLFQVNFLVCFWQAEVTTILEESTGSKYLVRCQRHFLLLRTHM